METVMIRAYRYRHEADLARAMLDAAGIRTVLSADDAGGMRPEIMSVNPIRLYVASEDAELANEILAESDEADTAEE